MERQMEPGTWELTVFEKNAAEGGTWYENKYPGCACDIPAHIYTYSWDPQPNWSSFYAYAPEILEYFKKFSDKHDLHHYVQLNSQVVSATWNDQEGIYKLIIENPQTGEQREDWSHVLVNASGNLNKWKCNGLQPIQPLH
jgi:cation diffusion facilitator CzcD-associated flavoprotein CzcO